VPAPPLHDVPADAAPAFPAAPSPAPEPPAYPGPDSAEPPTGLQAGDPLGAPAPAPAAPGEGELRAEASVAPPGYSEPTSGYAGGPVPPGAYAPPVPQAQPMGNFQLASWGSRALALIIDSIIISIVSIVLIALLGALFGGLGSLGGDSGGLIGFWIGAFFAIIPVFIVSLVYQPFWMARNGGATIGKQAMKITVIRTNGQSTDFGWSALRQVVVIQGLFGFLGGIFLLGIPILIDYLWPLWDEENRALHDMLVQSRVVKT
jgi:uncharacterized RDD family membrane protein YckC